MFTIAINITIMTIIMFIMFIIMSIIFTIMIIMRDCVFWVEDY
jgi:preprotein translocase subunit SecG